MKKKEEEKKEMFGNDGVREQRFNIRYAWLFVSLISISLPLGEKKIMEKLK